MTLPAFRLWLHTIRDDSDGRGDSYSQVSHPQSEVQRALDPVDAALVAQIQQGSTAVFEEMVRAHYAGLCTYSASLVGRRDIAEEIVQDMLFNIWKLGERWSVHGSVAGYLYRSVRHAAARHRTRLQRETNWVNGHDTSDLYSAASERPDVLVQEHQLAAAVAQAIAALPPRTREAFLLTRRARLTHAEAAQVMQVSVKTIEAQVGMALRTLRGQLSEHLK